MASAAPAFMDRLRSFIGATPAPSGGTNVGDQLGGLFRIGALGSYSGQAWYFSRLVNAVYHNPTGFRCVDAIASAFTRAPLTCYAEGDTIRQTPKSSPLQALLDRPVPFGLGVPAVSGKAAARKRARDLTLAGMSLTLKVRGTGLTDGPITQLRRLAPQRVTIIGNEHDEWIGTLYHDRLGARIPLLPQWVLYERFSHPDRDFMPFPPALAAGLAAETDTKAAQFNLDLLNNDGAIPAVVMLEGLTPDRFNEWVSEWEAGEDPGKVRFMGFTGTPSGGKSVEIVKIGQTNEELTYDKLRDFSQEDIARALGCPPVVTFNMAHETYANADREIKHWYSSTILSYWDQSSDELTSQLGGEYGVALGYDVNKIAELQESQDTLVDRNIKLQGSQNMTVNESNRRLGLPEVPWGDEPLIPVTPMQPLPPLPGGPAAAPAEDDPVPPLAPAKPKAKAALPSFKRTGPASLAIVSKPSRETAAPTTAAREAALAALLDRSARRLARLFDRQGRAVAKRITTPGRERSASAVARRGLFDAERWQEEVAEEFAAIAADSEMAGMPVPRLLDIAKQVNDDTKAQLEEVVAASLKDSGAVPEMAAAVTVFFAKRGTDTGVIVKAELEKLEDQS